MWLWDFFVVTNSFTPKLPSCCSCISGCKPHCINTLGFSSWKGLWWKAECCNGLSEKHGLPFRGQVAHDRIEKLILCSYGVPGKCKGSLQMRQVSNWKKKNNVLFLLALSQTVANLWFTFLLKQTRLSAAQSPFSFIYMHLLTLEERSSQTV